MRDFREAKAMAHTLRAALTAMGFKITVSQSLELIAQSFGVADWNTLAAAIRLDSSAASMHIPPTTAAADSDEPPGFSNRLVSTLNETFSYAKDQQHGQVKLEHLLLLLLDDADAAPVMEACGVDLNVLRKDLTHLLEAEPRSATSAGNDPSPTVSFQRVLQRAVFHTRNSDRAQVASAQVLVALFSEKTSRAVQLLNEQGMSRLDAVNFISHGLTRDMGNQARP